MINDKDAVHLILGLSAAASIQNAHGLRQNQTIVCLDVPSLGRQFEAPNYDDWNSKRLAEIRTLFGDDIVEATTDMMGASLFTNSDLLNSNNPLIIWSDDMLSTQLMIAFVCHLFAAQDLDCSRIHVLSYSSDYAVAQPLGSLTESELIERRHSVEKMSTSEIQIYSKIWNLYCSDKPENHLKLARETTFLDCTQNATACILRRYPEKSTGLDAIQTELLHYGFKNAPKTARIIADAMGFNDTADKVGDLHLFNQLIEMGEPALRAPLLKLNFSSDECSMQNCSTEILPLARDVYEGKENFVELNGIDRWIGGVHQTTDNCVYREDLFT